MQTLAKTSLSAELASLNSIAQCRPNDECILVIPSISQRVGDPSVATTTFKCRSHSYFIQQVKQLE